jgi:hypothetical protein
VDKATRDMEVGEQFLMNGVKMVIASKEIDENGFLIVRSVEVVE